MQTFYDALFYTQKYLNISFILLMVFTEASPVLQTTEYWGTRQQLRAGKVIADWIDPLYGPLDPIFGVLLCPTAGEEFCN